MRRRNKKTDFPRKEHKNVPRMQEREQTDAGLTSHQKRLSAGSSGQQSCSFSVAILGPDKDPVTALS